MVACRASGTVNTRGMSEQHLIVSIDELARQLRLSKRWLHAEATARRIPSLKAGQRRLFNVEAVRRSLAARAAQTGEDLADRASHEDEERSDAQ